MKRKIEKMKERRREGQRVKIEKLRFNGYDII